MHPPAAADAGADSASPVRVLFVCLGNICRSPMAQGVFEDQIAQASLAGRITADSAGIGDWHVGQPPDPRAQAAMRDVGLDIGAQRCRQITAQDFTRFNLIIGMDDANMAALRAMAPPEHAHKLHRLLDYAAGHEAREVPDPFFGAAEGFARTRALIEAGGAGLLHALLGGPAR